MALVINDRVKETTTTTGTGAVSLAGAVTGFETFAAGVGNSNTTYYAIVHQTANEFEVGLGTLDGDSSDLTRTTVISSSNSDSAVDFAAGTKDVFCTIPASKLIFEDANNDATIGRNLTVTGDLTVSGDDITMATNTAGNILVADGTNFNSIAVGGLSEISSVASDDVLMAVDTSGGGLKKIARSTLVSGLATSSAISNVVEDTSPQLGGNLDMNGADIVTTSNADLELAPNGTGHVTVKGNTNSGAIQFNCEQNSHGQIIIGAAHSAGATNTLTIPSTGGNSTLVSDASTSTLTNKTLTSPKINEDVAVTSTATELNVLDGITAVVGELNALDIGATAIGTAVASKAVILDANKDYTGFRNITLSGELDAGSLDVSGDADIDGTLEADAITIGGVTLAETISDTVGAMVGSNTETGISVTYDDSDNTLDFVIGAGSIVNSMLADDAVGADELAANAVVNASVASGAAIADTKLATISTAGKVALTALEIDGGSDIGADLADADLIIVDDGAGGTNKKAAISRIKTYLSSAGFSQEDPTALAIALG